MVQKRIFTYWVNDSNQEMPAYIRMCMESWQRHIDNLEIIVLNHENLAKWIDLTMDIQLFKKLTLPMQSDIVSYYVLHKHGGIYMDADTIVLKDIFEEIMRFDESKIYAFGNPEQKTIHVAFIASLKKRQKLLFEGIKKAQSNLHKLSRGNTQLTWDLFSNSIYHELIRNDATSTFIIMDRIELGSILETVMQTGNPGEDYSNFYFRDNQDMNFEDIIGRINFGVVLLHNSWTPVEFKRAGRESILHSQTLLSRLLKYAIGYVDLVTTHQ
jgi:hypothetical protein